jgi:hypothetical protein
MANEESGLQRLSAYAQIISLPVAVVAACFTYLQLNAPSGSASPTNQTEAKTDKATEMSTKTGTAVKRSDEAEMTMTRAARARAAEAEARARQAEERARAAEAEARVKEAERRAKELEARAARRKEAEEAAARARAAEAEIATQLEELKAWVKKRRQEAARREPTTTDASKTNPVVYYRCPTQRIRQLEEDKVHDFVALCRQLNLSFFVAGWSYNAGGTHYRPARYGGPRDAGWRRVRARSDAHAEVLVQRLRQLQVEAQRESPELLAD